MLKIPIHNKIVYIARKLSVIDVMIVKKVQTLTRRGVGDAASGLGLHFLHMSECPFSHDAGHIMYHGNSFRFANFESKKENHYSACEESNIPENAVDT